MKHTSRVVPVLPLVVAFATSLAAQANTPLDPNVQQLQEQLTQLQEKQRKLEEELVEKGLSVPSIQTVSPPILFANRAYLTVQLSTIGRVQITVRRTDDVPFPVVRTGFATRHENILIPRLEPETPYTATIQVLRQEGDQPAVNRPAQTVDFITPRGMNPPQVAELTPEGIATTATTISFTARSTDQQVYLQAQIFDQILPNRVPADSAFRTEGHTFTRHLDAPKSPPQDRSRTITFSGLKPGTTYYVRVIGTNSQGFTDMTERVAVTTKDREFGFDGAVEILISPAKGLVLTWRATTPADSGKLSLPITRPGEPARTELYMATKGADSRTFSATIPYQLVQNVAETPTLSLFLYGPTTQTTGIRLGLQNPQQSDLNAPGLTNRQRRDIQHWIDRTGRNELPNLDVVLRAGLKAVAMFAGVAR